MNSANNELTIMIRFYRTCLLFLCLISKTLANEVIRINQLGYLPEGPKIAVFISDQTVTLKKFTLVNNLTRKVVFEGIPQQADGTIWGQKSAWRLDFSSVVQP